MKAQKRISTRRKRRGFRVHNRIRRDHHGRARLSVFRSNKHIYAQVIDDTTGRTLVSASSTESDGPGGNCDAAREVGTRVAERAIGEGIKEVSFDRGRFGYHGRIASLADAAREAGLSF